MSANGLPTPDELQPPRLPPPTSYHDVAGDGPDKAVARAGYINGENAARGIAYSVPTLNDTGTLAVRAGYDDVTGLGTPDGAPFLSALSH